MTSFLNNIFKTNKSLFKIQSFTFFIPAPPPRTTGYREKQFDKLFYEFINQGYEILSFNTQACTGSNQSGMWVVCVVRALNKKADELSLNDFFQDKTISPSKSTQEVDGLYYIKDHSSEEI